MSKSNFVLSAAMIEAGIAAYDAVLNDPEIERVQAELIALGEGDPNWRARVEARKAELVALGNPEPVAIAA